MKKTYLTLGVLVTVLVVFQIVNPSCIRHIRCAAVDSAKIPLTVISRLFGRLYEVASFQNRYERQIALLEQKVAGLANQAAGVREIVEENRRLRALLSFKNQLAGRAIAAEIIGHDSASWQGFAIIDKGADDGIRQGMTIAQAAGLVGIALEVGKGTSKIMMIDDPSFRLGALIQRTREQGVLVGAGGGLCKLIYLSYDSDVNPGDTIVTAASDSAPQRTIVIGEVVKVLKGSNALYTSAIVKPACNLFKVEEVVCVE